MSAKYIIEGIIEPDLETYVVAEVEVDDQGVLHYRMVVPNQEIEQVLELAVRSGGLYRSVPFEEVGAGGFVHRGLFREYVPLTDHLHLADALNANLGGYWATQTDP
jgi:hypothetical protein